MQFPDSVSHAMPVDASGKLVLAKMKSMIKRGLVDGCPCGCRGDFVITEKGLLKLKNNA
jgi:predicted transcriptional regulator